MAKKKLKMQFRYYTMAPNSQVLALLGEDEWRREYGKDEQGRYIPELHFHNYMEVGICHEGCGKTILRNEEYEFKEGSIAIVPPNFPHNNISEFGTTGFWEWMFFDMENILLGMREMSHNNLDVEYLKNAIYDAPLFFQQEEYPQIVNLILEIRDECERKVYMYHEKLRGLLQASTVELLRIRNTREEISRKNPRNIQIVPAIEYVKAHYAEEIRIQDLADVCSISTSHFRKIFQECMHMPPNDYVNAIRVHEAARILLKTHLSMEETAYRVGYESVSTFTRNFKKIMGMTPYQWKKSPDNYAGQMLNFKISALKGW